jgi:hypothetical protein
VPDHATLSRRAETLQVPRPQPGCEPLHLLVDSTGLRLGGPGEWLLEKHGGRACRSWKKLHLGTDADTGRIVAPELTGDAADDGSRVGPLLDQMDGPVASFTADGAFDRDDVHGEVTRRHPGAAVIVPPRSSAVPSGTAEVAPTQRDRPASAPHRRARPHGLAEGIRLQSARPDRGGHCPLEAGDRRCAARCARTRTGVRRPRWPLPPTS